MYLDINDIGAVQIDHTSKCNLLCPQCARVDKGVGKSIMPIDELTVSDYEVIFPKNIIKNMCYYQNVYKNLINYLKI